MSEMVRTQVELPRDVLEVLKQRSEAQGITPAQQIVEALTAYLKAEVDPIFQADDPILHVAAAMGSGLGDLATHHDRYLYRKDWQERAPGEVSE